MVGDELVNLNIIVEDTPATPFSSNPVLLGSDEVYLLSGPKDVVTHFLFVKAVFEINQSDCKKRE